MEEQGETSFYLAGLGSLINCKSASRTLKSVPYPAKPIKVFGFIRVYDYIVSNQKSGQTPLQGSCPVAALNAYPSEKHWFNGALLRVCLEDVPAFRAREVGYNLLPAEFVPYADRTAKRRKIFVLSRPRVPGIFRLIPNGFSPAPAYHAICRDGAERISRAFLRDFYRTTFMADRETRLEDCLCDVSLRPKQTNK